MKTILIGALALSLAAGGATAQRYDGGGDRGGDHGDNRGDNRGGDRGGDYRNDRGQGFGDNHDHGRHMHRGWGHDYNGPHQWRRGQRMGYNDWNGARAIDYRRYHLRQPPRGYEWRESNGQYVLAAVATGLIASIILNSGR
jgi:Ni/Co efflux regulator RcnB